MTVTSDPDVHAALEDTLVDWNQACVGTAGSGLQVCLRSGTDGLVAGISGAVWGTTAWIHVLWVAPELRSQGLGSALVTAFESRVRDEGCRHVLVSTYSFQARPFYEGHGFEAFAAVDDVPVRGMALTHLRKRLEPTDEA